MKAPFLRTPYNYDREAASNESGLLCEDASLTVQDGAEETDINWIVDRYLKTGELPTTPRMPVYGDFTGINNYRDALDAVMAADDAFMELPAELRRRFNNDPEVFVEFCLDESNREELGRLGLLKEVSDEVQKKADVVPGSTDDASGTAAVVPPAVK